MLAGVLITLREGLEAFLIVGILLGYLTKIEQPRSKRYVWLGALTAIALSALIAVGFQLLAVQFEGELEEIFEVAVGLLAVGVLTWMVLWMQRQSRTIKSELETKMAQAISANQLFGLASLAFVSIFREGVETALFLAALAGSAERAGLLPGAIIGLVISAVIAYLIFNTSVRLNLRRFFIVTGSLLILIAAGILVNAVHGLEELGLVPGILATTVWNTSGLVADGSLAGRLLHAFVGYTSKPMLLQAVLYLAYVIGFGGRFYRTVQSTAPTPRPTAPAKPEPEPARSE